MTYKEHLRDLEKEVIEKLQNLFKAEDELLEQEDGFIDKSLLDKRSSAYSEWQNAQNNYYAFLSHFVKLKVNIDDSMVTSK